MLSKKIYVLFLNILVICLFNFYEINVKILFLSNKMFYLNLGYEGIG